jgi:SAM-dependent methyltransferase
MPLLSDYAKRRKIKYFLASIPKDARILEIGYGSGWCGDYLKQHGWKDYHGLNLVPPADYVGSVKDWRKLGLEPESFDVIIAFEVIEHVDCFRECYDLLKRGGELLVTSPFPPADWLLRVLEWVGLNQKRTSPHDHLVYLHRVQEFEHKEIKLIALLSQWGTFKKMPERQARTRLAR